LSDDLASWKPGAFQRGAIRFQNGSIHRQQTQEGVGLRESRAQQFLIFAKLFFGALVFGDIARDFGGADDPTLRILDGGDGQRHV
jgi:hypothetical protein